MIKVPDRITRAALRRIEIAQPTIQNVSNYIQNGIPLQAEPDRDRAVQRVAAIARISSETASRIVNNEDPSALGLTGESLRKAEAIQGKTIDYVGVAWLEAGRIATHAVARIVFLDGQPQGTGFLVSDRLFLTNNHVIADKASARGMLVEFRYELGLDQRLPAPIRFELDPDAFFETDETDDLDFTLIALGRPINSGVSVSEFGCCPLSSSSAKHTVGEPVNIVQHPNGDYKQVIVRENRIVHRGNTVLHYVADTEPGASGSPVFNDEWQVVALHHWGAPHREQSRGSQRLRTDVNEGIRVSAIVHELQKRLSGMTTLERQLLVDALKAPAPGEFGTRRIRQNPSDGAQSLSSIITENNYPSYTMNNGATLAVFEGSSERGGGAPANRIDRNYSNRRGYSERFLSGFQVPMPQLNATQRSQAARVSGVGEIANPFELKYQHFSVVLNATRRMAFFSICNIDGAKRFRIDRDTGRAVSGPEATETWALDPRVPEEVQLSDAFYARLRRDLRAPDDDFFARGHLTRREDPNWGTTNSAERANDDTFHHTNACPQVQKAFNGSQKAWQGIENFILDSTDDANLKVTVITGPVFSDDDPEYEDEEFGPITIPQIFWKVVARVENGKPIVFAVLADQSEATDALFGARPESKEAAFVWPKKLSKEYISTVKKIEELTELDFGDLGNHDIFAEGRSENRSAGQEIKSPEILFPKSFVNVSEGFGRYTSINSFLVHWEQTQAERAESPEEEISPGAERAERRRPRRRPPEPRKRKVVKIEAKVARVFADDLSGAKHQQFTIIPTKWVSGDAKSEVESAQKGLTEVRVAVRFGDSRGLPDRIPGIRTDVELEIKGEWISAKDAFDVGGEDIPVLHFTHDPLGFICTPSDCFS
ncbi:Serine protease [Tumidithrix helvetica PCC 7403]|uniref:DNA/RNA non-specific endonuclease n=1 Tax=Tumidithrix helvetica TaxID=3457545 RepID=UPI003C97C491